jgi:hypothetical protein
LGISDLFVSLHRLLRARKDVLWHWIPLTWAFTIFLAAINIWFAIHFYLDDTLSNTAGGFILLITPIVCVLMLSMAVLPDKPDEGETDLLKWYFNQKNYIFSLFLLNWLSFAAVKLVEQYHTAVPFKWGQLSLIAPALIFVTLIASRNYWLHAILTVFVAVVFVSEVINQRMALI